MTCIVGIEFGGKCYIGGDSLGSNGYTGSAYDRPKVFKKDDIIFGVCGSYRTMQVLEFNLSIPKRAVGQSSESFLFVDFIEAVRNEIKARGNMKVENQVESIAKNASFLIGVEGKIYVIQNDLSILRSKSGYAAVGSGENFAESALYTLKESGAELSPHKMIELAIRAASNFSVSVNDDIVILESD